MYTIAVWDGLRCRGSNIGVVDRRRVDVARSGQQMAQVLGGLGFYVVGRIWGNVIVKREHISAIDTRREPEVIHWELFSKITQSTNLLRLKDECQVLLSVPVFCWRRTHILII